MDLDLWQGQYHTQEGGSSGALGMWVLLRARSKPKWVSEQCRVPRGQARDGEGEDSDLQLHSDPHIPILGRQFCTTQAYEGSRSDELSVPSGARVHVLETSDRGWWLCRYSEVCVSLCGGAVAGSARPDGNIGNSLTKPCFSCRYNGRTGLLPAMSLQPEGLGSLLGRPGFPDSAGADKVAEDRTIPPVVPTRPCMSAIQSRCCSITRRALAQEQGTRVPR